MNTFADKVKRIQETLRQASMDFTFEGSAAAEDQLRMASEAIERLRDFNREADRVSDWYRNA